MKISKKTLLALVFLILAGFFNELILVRILGEGSLHHLGFRLLLGFVTVSLLATALFLKLAKTRQGAFRVMFGFFLFWIGLILLLSAGELFLVFKEKKNKQGGKDFPYSAAYKPFAVQHLHPFYYFFFPQDQEALDKINNDVVSVDENGFRGPGPQDRGERRLAFILGGSAAFGHGSSSDMTTISGYLNELQDEYFFVNAGVPSWNSTQEFYRFSLQLVAYEPDLVVIFDGFNDANLNYSLNNKEIPYPPGTAESYDDLRRRFDDIRNNPLVTLNKPRLVNLVFPQVLDLTHDKLEESFVEANEIPVKGTEDYLHKIELMQNLAASYGIDFLAIWQPIFFQHQNISVESREILNEEDQISFLNFLRGFNNKVFGDKAENLNLVDFSNIFDKYYENVELDTIFLDQVHLSDLGNRIVASEISKLIK